MRQVEWGAPVTVQTMFRCLAAVHLSSYVDSKFTSRGGLMLVSPPGSMKTSLLMSIAHTWPNAIPVSDLNSVQLSKMKSAMSSQHLRTLILTDMQKIAQRNPAVAANLLGNLSAVVDEGYTGADWDANHMIPRTVARCTIMGAVTDDYYSKAMDGFVQTGFARRFLWAQVRLQDPAILAEAIIHQERLRFTADIGIPPNPVGSVIPFDLTTQEIRDLEPCVQYQIGRNAIAFQLIVKMASVLKWWYKGMKIEGDPMDTIFEFARCLGTNTEPSCIIGFIMPGGGFLAPETAEMSPDNGKGVVLGEVSPPPGVSITPSSVAGIAMRGGKPYVSKKKHRR